jgi:hypothetical protein
MPGKGGKAKAKAKAKRTPAPKKPKKPPHVPHITMTPGGHGSPPRHRHHRPLGMSPGGPKQPRRRKLSPALDYDGCAVAALAASLYAAARIRAAPGELADLFAAAGGQAEGGLALAGLAAAAARAGLAGARLVHARPLPPSPGLLWVPGLIIGVDLPAPHYLATAAPGWWQPGDWPGAAVEEAWEVGWAW